MSSKEPQRNLGLLAFSFAKFACSLMKGVIVMIDRYITMKTEEQAKRYAKELNSMSGVWGGMH